MPKVGYVSNSSAATYLAECPQSAHCRPPRITASSTAVRRLRAFVEACNNQRVQHLLHAPDIVMTSRHIGIVACSAEGAALCYRTICVEGTAILGLHAHPEVTVHTFSLADYMACIYRGDWAGVGELMLHSAYKLKAVGADFLICPDNTIHRALPHVVRRSPLPRLHIAEEVAREAVARGFKRLAITGTRWLVDSRSIRTR